MYKKLYLVIAMLMIASLVLSACGAKTEEPATPAVEVAETEVAEAEVVETEVVETEVAETEVVETEVADDSGQRYPKITIALNSDPQDLLPYNVNSGAKPFIYQNFYETLFDLESNEYVPVLAKDFTIIDDLHWQVELYDYIYDSAGNNITADDVVFSTNFLVEAGFAFKYYMFESVTKVDDYTVEYTWTKPITDVGELEFPWCRTIIFSQAAFESGNFATAPVATGHYVVTEFVSGSKVVLEANDNYWQTDESLISQRHQANVQTIEYDIIAESSQHVIGLETGAIDYSQQVPNENLAEFQDGGQFADQFNVDIASGSFVFGLVINQSEGNPGSDLNFRLAVYYAIDNEAVATALGGTYLPSKAFGTPHFPDYVAAWDETPNYINTYDPDLAREYLDQTTYDGETLTFVTTADETGRTIATVIQSFLVNIGINTEIQTTEPALAGALYQDPTSFDLVINGMGGGSQIGEWNRVMNNLELGTGYSVGFVTDPELQRLFEVAKAIDTHTPENMTALHNYVLANGYQYAIVSPRLNMVYTSDIAEIFLRENEFILPGACTYVLP